MRKPPAGNYGRSALSGGARSSFRRPPGTRSLFRRPSGVTGIAATETTGPTVRLDGETPAKEDPSPRLRPAAKALVRSSSAVLLVAERHADGTLYWTLPGGGVHGDESVPEALRRELREELGCRSVVGDRVSSFWYRHTSLENTVSVYSVRECALRSEPRPVRADGVVAVRWVPPTDPPAGTLLQVRTLLENCDRPGDRERRENEERWPVRDAVADGGFRRFSGRR